MKLIFIFKRILSLLKRLLFYVVNVNEFLPEKLTVDQLCLKTSSIKNILES